MFHPASAVIRCPNIRLQTTVSSIIIVLLLFVNEEVLSAKQNQNIRPQRNSTTILL